ncbi:hypothetical protein MTO96_031404 [Rhipicephalus appendiculatus]
MSARTMLAVLHHNANSTRQQACGSDGEPLFKRKLLKSKKGNEVVCPVKESATYADFSGTTTEPHTRTAKTAYNGPGQPGLEPPAYATTATQVVNQQAALRACCSSPDSQGNSTTAGSRSDPTAESAPPLRDILIHRAPGMRVAKPRKCKRPGPKYADT